MKSALVALFAVAAIGCSAVGFASEEKHDHAGHDHSKHAGEGELKEVGKVALVGTTITVNLTTDFVPGKDLAITASLPKGSSDESVLVLRAWVGNEQAEQTGKNKGEKEGRGEFHVHGMVPKTLTAKDAIWIEVEGKDKKKVRGSVPLPSAKK